MIVGSALAWREHAFKAPAALACLGFALLVQIGANFANDYYDFIKGADTAERVGPRRAVASGLVAPAVMRTAMWLVTRWGVERRLVQLGRLARTRQLGRSRHSVR